MALFKFGLVEFDLVCLIEFGLVWLSTSMEAVIGDSPESQPCCPRRQDGGRPPQGGWKTLSLIQSLKLSNYRMLSVVKWFPFIRKIQNIFSQGRVKVDIVSVRGFIFICRPAVQTCVWLSFAKL